MRKSMGILVVWLLIGCFPFFSQASGYDEGLCERAFFKCLMISAAALGSPMVAGSLAAFCVSGYVWCKNFYQE